MKKLRLHYLLLLLHREVMPETFNRIPTPLVSEPLPPPPEN